MLKQIGLLALVVSACTACVTAQPTTLAVPPEYGQQCANICSGLGMKLGAVVVIRNSSGCVCEPAAPAGASTPQQQSSRAAGAGAAGGALVAIEQEIEAQEQQRRIAQQNQMSQHH